MRPPLASMANVVDAFIEGGIGSDLWRFKCLVNSVAGPTVIELKCRFKSDVLSPVWGVADWTCRQDCMFRIVPMWGGEVGLIGSTTQPSGDYCPWHLRRTRRPQLQWYPV